MSLFGTIAHDRPIPAKRTPPRRLTITGIAVVVALVVGVVFAAVSLAPGSDVTDTANGTNVGQLSHARFTEVNTIALDALAPPASAEADNTFLYWNVGALDDITPVLAAHRVDSQRPDFLYWNTTTLEYPPPVRGEWTPGPR